MSSTAGSAGFFSHIGVLGIDASGSDFQDFGLWSTGNGWVAAGILRVLATMQNSQYKNTFKNEINALKDWVNEIHDGMYTYLVRFSHLSLSHEIALC